MDEVGECQLLSGRLESPNVIGRPRTGDRQQSFDRLQHARHAAERERGGAEPDDFTVVWPFVTSDDLNRVGCGIRVIEVRVKTIERLFEQRVAEHSRDRYYSSMRVLRKALAGVILLAVVAFVAAYIYARRSIPVLNGTIEVIGPSAPIDIIRDADAIPHVFASTKLDALFGLGYVHAQDRLWQMEFQRRIGFGRLSEIFGATTLPQDRFLRTVGFGRAARATWDRLDSPAKRQVEAYVAGVNAFVADHHGSRLPPEFSLLRFEPEPWSGPDVVVWQKMVAWDLSGNYSLELIRHDILNKVGSEKLSELMPPYARNGSSILTERETAPLRFPGSTIGRSGSKSTAFSQMSACHAGKDRLAINCSANSSTHAALLSGLTEGLPEVSQVLLGGSKAEALGSNNWVVDGSRTVSGFPLLANDPHLNARLPSIWYLAHLSAGDYDAIGASFPGTPGIILGRNRSIAWGATNVAADVEDLYREQIDTSGKLVEYRGKLEPLQIIPETIRIRGREDVHLDVRISRHGPLVSDALNANNAASSVAARRALAPLEPLAFRWTALDADDTTLAAMLKISEAHSWSDFTEALRDFVVPSQNFVYADTAGHIGYYAPGRVPIRSNGDGSLPSTGWTGESEWTGWIPFDDLPHTYDPPGHVIVTANQRPMPASYPYLVGLDWPESYRAQRIANLLDDRTKLNPDDFATIQRDTFSLHAQTILPLLLSLARPEGAATTEAIRVLRRWNYDARPESAAAAIYEAWFLHLAPMLLADKLGQLTMESYQGRFSYVTRFLQRTLAAGTDAASNQRSHPGDAAGQTGGFWCDDPSTTKQETCEWAVSRALRSAIEDLVRRQGSNMSRWRWDVVHRARFPHQGLDSVFGIGRLLSRSAPSAGDWSTVNVGSVTTDNPYDQMSIASYRQIIDLSPANDSRFIDAVGQSGHPQSPHYDDFLSDWQAVKHRPMRIERTDIEQGAIGRIRLTPR
jgi:penicillin amidase